MDAAARLAELLISRNLRVAVVETTAGGLLCARLTSVSGSSQWFERGFVAYSQAAKLELLTGSDDLLAAHGNVSEAIACALASAVRERCGVDLCVAETGIAGPIRGRSGKPVGTCFLAVATASEVVCEHHVFAGDRPAIREAIVERALAVMLKIVTATEGVPGDSTP